MPNNVFLVEVPAPTGKVLVKVLGNEHSTNPKLQITSESTVSLAAAKQAVADLGAAVSAAAV